MQARDVLDELAWEHRDLHDAADRLLAQPELSQQDVRGFVVAISRHEAAERVLVQPLLERDPRGRSRQRTHEANHQLLSSRVAALLRADDDDRHRALTLLRPILVGHTDRDEIETYPFVRHVTTREELRALAVVRGELDAALRRGSDTLHAAEDPLDAAADRARELLREADGPVEALRTVTLPELSASHRRTGEEPTDG